jgi:hypothetical protein
MARQQQVTAALNIKTAAVLQTNLTTVTRILIVIIIITIIIGKTIQQLYINLIINCTLI